MNGAANETKPFLPVKNGDEWRVIDTKTGEIVGESFRTPLRAAIRAKKLGEGFQITYAVHNLHTPPVALFNGKACLDDKFFVTMPEPLAAFFTLEDARQWQAERLAERVAA